MTTIVNTPGNTDSNADNGISSILVVGLLIVFFLIIVYFGLPYLRRAFVAQPINIPEKIDVNVNTSN